MCKLEMVWDLGIKGAFCCCDSVFGWFGIPGRELFFICTYFLGRDRMLCCCRLRSRIVKLDMIPQQMVFE